MRACLKLPVFLLDIAIFSACALAQTVENPKLKRLDEEYRKLDGFVSFLRDRNKDQFAIDLTKGVDEERFIEIGGIEPESLVA